MRVVIEAEELERLKAENALLKQQLSELEEHMAQALARIAELEKLKTPPPPFLRHS